jgi:hypothetical protein
MDEEELHNHHDTLKLIQKDLQFVQANEPTVEDDEGDK